MGFCGLDRSRDRQPLRGDEVRPCWVDGAVPLPPEPSIPGLLDLLTERMLPMVAGAEPSEDAAALDVERLPSRPARPVQRLRSMTPTRDWVELEV